MWELAGPFFGAAILMKLLLFVMGGQIIDRWRQLFADPVTRNTFLMRNTLFGWELSSLYLRM
jgi:hypothetical protein